MRTISAALQAHLDTKATTLCFCWKITRADGVVVALTNHDLNLTFDSVTYERDAGLTGSQIEESLGLGVDNQDVEGFFNSGQITEADIAAGLYDHALVEIFEVNWEDVSERALWKRGRIGEITRGKTGFQAEFRSLSAELDQPTGRVYSYACDAIVGDARCGVDLTAAAFKGTATVSNARSNRSITTTGLSAFAANWFAGGILTFTSGANAGKSFEVKSHSAGAAQIVTLWRSTIGAIEAGDGFTITAGCDKRFATCKAKFSNPANFRGFPHIPDEQVIIRYPNQGDANLDGGGNFLGAD